MIRVFVSMANPSTYADVRENWSFSGPPPSDAEVRGTCSNETSFSLETAKAVLLQLRDSVTSTEFQKLLDGVSDTSTTEAKQSSVALGA